VHAVEPHADPRTLYCHADQIPNLRHYLAVEFVKVELGQWLPVIVHFTEVELTGVEADVITAHLVVAGPCIVDAKDKPGVAPCL
jgi:hypothetical protein